MLPRAHLNANTQAHCSRTSKYSWPRKDIYPDNLDSVSLVARVSPILADTIVIVATWVTMRRQVQESFSLKLRPSTSSIMLADGTLISAVHDNAAI